MESLIELANIENLDKSNIFPDYSQSLINGISNISKSQFGEHYHYLCKKCNNVPLTRFITKDKILFICKCEESPRELLIKDIYNFLFYSKEKKMWKKYLNAFIIRMNIIFIIVKNVKIIYVEYALKIVLTTRRK